MSLASDRALGGLHRTEIDGVRAVWSPLPGPFRAQLVFRVGMSDEPLPWRGASHLVEHLTLSRLADHAYAFNGEVTTTTTTFDFTGPADALGAFLSTTTASLATLPFDRLDAERRILRVEGSRSGYTWRDMLACQRWGIDGYGVAARLEPGLHWLEAAQLEQWRSHWFTRGNAVLLMTGPPPAGLRVDLPDGPARPQRQARPLPRHNSGPRWDRANLKGLALNGIGPQGRALQAGADVLGRRAHDKLRTELALVYAASAGYEALDATTAQIWFHTDGLPERIEEVRDALLDVLEQLRTTGPAPDEVASWSRRALSVDPERTAAELLGAAAHDMLTGRPIRDLDQRRAEIEFVRPEHVATALGHALGAADLLVPPGMTVLHDGWTRLDDGTLPIGDGQRWAPARHIAGDRRLVANQVGLQIENARGQRSALTWASVAMNLRYPDGHRELFCQDGTIMRIVPSEWMNGDALRAEIDRLVPKARTVEATGSGVAPVATAPSRRLSGLSAVSTGPLVLLIVGVALVTLLMVAAAKGQPGVFLGAFLSAAFLAWCVRCLVVRLRAPNRVAPRRQRTVLTSTWTRLMVALPTRVLAVVAGCCWLGPLLAFTTRAEGALWLFIPALSATVEVVRRLLPEDDGRR